MVAMFQHLVMHENLPAIMGPEFMRRFDLETKEHGYYRGMIEAEFKIRVVCK